MLKDNIVRLVESAKAEMGLEKERVESAVVQAKRILERTEESIGALVRFASEIQEPALSKFGPIFVGQIQLYDNRVGNGSEITSVDVVFGGRNPSAQCGSFFGPAVPTLPAGKYRVLVLMQKEG